MAQKIFISFLGAIAYEKTQYYFDTKTDVSKAASYVQEAIFEKFLFKFWSAEDKIFIFTTEDAHNNNYVNRITRFDFKTQTPIFSPEKDGLENILKHWHVKAQIAHYEPVMIKNGNNVEEIWSVFQTIYEKLKSFPNGTEIYFDITFGFRSLPMLGIVLLNYMKTLHNVVVKYIFYGNFEVGRQEKQSLIKKAEEEKVSNDQIDRLKAQPPQSPILNLVSFSQLQDWTKAAEIFMRYGNAKSLVELAKNEIQPLLKTPNQHTKIAREFNQLAKSLENVTDNLNTNRGKEIVSGNNFKKLHENIRQLSNDNFIVPMKPILEQISEKTKSFSDVEDWKNGFMAVEWCIKHDLIQQGITMLQESLFTYFCMTHQLNYTKQEHRDLISACFYIKNHDLQLDEQKWNQSAQDNKDKVIEILTALPKELAKDYDALTQGARNDINHGGFSKNESAANLKKKLNDSYTKIKLLLQIHL